MALSQGQTRALHTLQRHPMVTTVGLAQELDTTPAGAQKILDALYRRSLVLITDSGRWCISDRGRKAVSA